MGSSQSTDIVFLDDNDNWDANQYFRECFQANCGKTRFNMHCTLVMLINNGFVQKDLNYVCDSQKILMHQQELEENPDAQLKPLNDPHKVMTKFNDANWPYHIESFDGVYKATIQDLDCFRVQTRQLKLENGQKIRQPHHNRESLVFLPLSDITVNLDKMEAYYENRRKRFYKFVRSKDGKRHRNKLSKKYLYHQFMFDNRPQEEILKSTLGYQWSLQFKGSYDALPSIAEVFKGLYLFIAEYVERSQEGNPKKWIEKCKMRYKTAFMNILNLMDFQDREKPLTIEDFEDPNSKATCSILYLYSMETPFCNELSVWTPPPDATLGTGLYSMLSKSKSVLVKDVQDEMDKRVRELGPFDRCMQQLLTGKAEQNRLDRLVSSKDIIAPASYLLFKGAYMTGPKIIEWKNNIGKKVCTPTITSFSENFRQAVYSSRHYNKNKEMKSVVFVLTVFNEITYPGFRLNNEKYSAYPDEEEVLLASGTQFEIEGYENMECTSFTPKVGQEDLIGKKIHIIYLVRFG